MNPLLQVTILDDAESLFFGRELEFVKSRTYDVKYPALKCRDLIPMSTEAGPGAETIKYDQYDMVGQAKIVGNYANDLPRADVKGKEFRSPVKSVADSFGYNIQEIRAAKMAGKPLEQRKANAARRAAAQKENQIAFFGDVNSGLPGLFSNPNIQQYVAPSDGTGASCLWSTKSAVQILRDLTGIVSTVISNTKGVELPDTLVLPLSRWSAISTLQMPNIDKTVLQFFLANNPSVKNVAWLNELETAGAGGTARAMVYVRDEEHLTLEVPQDFEMFPAQPKGLEYVIPCHQRCGGTIIYYPMSIAFMDGI